MLLHIIVQYCVEIFDYILILISIYFHMRHTIEINNLDVYITQTVQFEIENQNQTNTKSKRLS